MASYHTTAQDVPFARKAGLLANYAGAAVSLGLLVGVGIWGYQLIMRDVSGIPVVRAMEGDMRVAPDNPGGEVALNMGLSVNEVAAVGQAAAPEDVLMLAPPTPGLTEEDLEAQPAAEAGEVQFDQGRGTGEMTTTAALTDETGLTMPAGPLTTDDILALADQIAAGEMPLSALIEDEAEAEMPVDEESSGPGVEIVADMAETDVEVAPQQDLAVIPASVPGVSTSLRPAGRPAQIMQVLVSPDAVNAALAEATSTVTVSRGELPVGTHLVQLGAYPTPDVAATAWVSLKGRFGDFLAGKDRLIQEASTGGETFYRLRVAGFDDLAGARRFCAALTAGNADCIPVVVR